MNGEIYEGYWIQNRPHGKGKQKLKNGSVYEGEFKNGSKDGFGRFSQSGKEVYEGQWSGDKPHGKGK